MITYAVDIDGTICTSSTGEYPDSVPIPEMIEKINQLYEQGHIIKMFTARGASSGVDWTNTTQEQLQRWGLKYHELIMNKKPSFDLLIDDKVIHISDFRKKYLDKKIVGFTASTFDIIHPGYVVMLRDARERCDYLIAALHIDPTIERKEKNKPVQTVDERRLVLESIKYIDEIVEYSTEQDLIDLLKQKKPDIRIIGTDWKNKEYTGKDLPIKIHWHQRKHDWSTTNLRRRIVEAKK
jgi:glycerol-3-phosphate cytidylyltransferase